MDVACYRLGETGFGMGVLGQHGPGDMATDVQGHSTICVITTPAKHHRSKSSFLPITEMPRTG